MNASSKTALKASNISVLHGEFKAVNQVSLELHSGEWVALVGPNGAGKTTLISTVCGLVTPSAGRIRVGGFDTVTQWRQARGLIGLVPQEISLEPFETVANTVRLSRGLFGLKRDEAAVERVLTALSLWDKRDAQIKTLSGGMKRRVLIAKALVHAPRVLFLDEPTNNLDPPSRQAVADALSAWKGAIILVSHDTEFVEQLAPTKVLLMPDGQVDYFSNEWLDLVSLA